MSEVIKIDSLPSKHGSIYDFLQPAIYCPIVGLVLTYLLSLFGIENINWLGYLLSAVSCVCWYYFYNRFGIACAGLKHGEKKMFSIIALSYLAGAIAYGIMVFLGNEPETAMVFGSIASIVLLLGIICFVRVGFILKNNYSGRLGEIGHGIIKSFFFGLGLIAITILTVVVIFAVPSSFLSIFVGILTAAYSIFWLILTYTNVWEPMVDMIESGFFEYKD